MSFALTHSRCQDGTAALAVSAETHLSGGLPSFTIVGLPETIVRESRARVPSALINSGFEFPRRRITVNLAPGDVPKEGTRFDHRIIRPRRPCWWAGGARRGLAKYRPHPTACCSWTNCRNSTAAPSRRYGFLDR